LTTDSLFISRPHLNMVVDLVSSPKGKRDDRTRVGASKVDDVIALKTFHPGSGSIADGGDAIDLNHREKVFTG